MEVVLFDLASVTLQLADYIGLRPVNPVGTRRAGPDLHQMADVIQGSRAVKFSSVG